MSDQGEKTCPLCAEEMDMTDQQLKPCKCGYEICVWCWHHVMDMAEKNESEGRCPACRTPYDKEKIVATAENCGRLMAEINTERKMKSQKAKTNKSSDGRKQLSSVRVIQRHLVYVVGLPLNLADEDLLQRKEYFAQYGKVLKVSMSRTTAGAIQQFPNNTCSVYITYSKEEEAIRCIQSVHGYILDGRSLKACFGTTKYCHAWLRNLPCTNFDCLYLHEIGLQEDSFTKDEIISSHIRVQEITGITNNPQRRSGNMLPPPSNDYYINSTAANGKPPTKNASNNSASIVTISPPNSSSGRSTALPAGASWGIRASNCQPPVANNAATSNGYSKNKPDPYNEPMPYTSVVPSTTQTCTVHNEVRNKLSFTEENYNVQAKTKLDNMNSVKQHLSADPQTKVSDYHIAAVGDPIEAGLPTPEDNELAVSMAPMIIRSTLDQGGSLNGKIQRLCSDISSISIGSSTFRDEQSGAARFIESTHQYYTDPVGSAVTATKAATTVKEVEDDLQLFNDQRLKDPEIATQSSYVSKLDDPLYSSNHSMEHSLCYNTKSYKEADFNTESMFGKMNALERSLPPSLGASMVSNNRYPDEGKGRQLGRLHDNATNVGNNAANDMGESSIISNILSMDFEEWDNPLTSPQSFAKLFGEADKHNGSLKLSSSFKFQNSNQSKFSFARDEEPLKNHQFVDADLSFNLGRMSNNHSFGQDYVDNRAPYMDNIGSGNSFSSSAIEDYTNISGSQYGVPFSRLSGSRSQISAPPGFSVPNRAPPPGFSSQQRMDQSFETLPGGQLPHTSSLSRNSYQTFSNVNNNSSAEIEFIDPAILSVGKGRLPPGLNNAGLDLRSSFHSQQQYSAYENDARIQMLMQRSVPPQQSPRFTDIGNGFSNSNNTYGIQSRHMDQNQIQFVQSPLQQQQSRNSLTSNGHWDGWSGGAQGGNRVDMVDLLRNDRYGYNNYYNGHEDSKLRVPSSSNLYNRTFEM